MNQKNERIGRVQEINRFPVKSVLGESLSSAPVDSRGILGDRLWAIKNEDGKFGSGKTTRRFQQMEGLFNFKAKYERDTPLITMPDGTEYRGDQERVNKALSELLGFPVTLAKEESISHFDEGPISIITTSALKMLSKDLGEIADSRRFRANLVIETEATGYLEDEWVDQLIQVGESVTLKIVAPLQRCIMVNNPQEELKQDARILKTLATHHAAMFGVWAKVERCGEIRVGDEAILLK
ncbi:MOSC domain-containing protein [Cytobacillus oceanisediminis]|uniref:MOSC domain-containing protein n=1 Tax=Cytobacillus TaxID=2675230 RepID=UPI001C21B030|nr:MOSC N-terminal beta barrel domain-containing protein [Cytobacillus oceanisediminis]MCS0826314.1 MOSC domain-containing protein [Cytobacillus firmus]MBU8730886.1 MOSC domain-containing protein [Cytobacillus oceanisediminis]MCM3244345.1 MOSC domain-containing protein [Cytobacillus oceanisediminis]MCM3401979.1 MOSC domain-containing protein [Cytobacillus oceanisediminis]MDK7666959.1 MOSC domain-containing protein [Cytobacillus oceanisediminis]